MAVTLTATARHRTGEIAEPGPEAASSLRPGDMTDAKRALLRQPRRVNRSERRPMNASSARQILRGNRRTIQVVGLLFVVQAAMLFLMVYPSYKPTPHYVPLGFVGPRADASALASRFGDALSVRTYPSERAARRAIEQREIYGALLVRPPRSELVVASAASPTVAQLLRQAVAPSTEKVEVRDVSPISPNDPHGAVIGLLVLPLISVSFAAVLALGALRLRRSAYFAALAAYALLGGIVVTSIVKFGFGALPGSFAALAGIVALTLLAIAFATAGLHRALGKLGVPVAALLFLFIASPASGNGSAPELLPGFWRQVGQFLPLGASGSALRNTSYFDGNAVVRPLLVLSAYAVVGVLLVAAAELAGRRRTANAAAGAGAELAGLGAA
jgi:hypothetical protein